ncbi:ATP-binding protein [Actinoplanes sichuanensis]|uniref:histidine kinase n=1 Tax=Actinoplanes sichuanensis TaxID=512349 RepID=A0ABW4AC83_9ACTN|nr:ATP-binding protein [Actinoplanes sichuanensis]
MPWPRAHWGGKRLVINAAIVAVLVTMVVLGFSVSARQERMAGEARRAQQLAQAVQQVKYRSADLNGWQNAYALDIERADAGTEVSRAQFVAAAARFDGDLTALERLPASPEIQTAVHRIRSAFDEFLTVDRSAVRLYRTGRPADRAAASELVLGRSVESYSVIAQACDTSVALATTAMDAHFAGLDGVGRSTRRYILVLSVIAVALAAAGALLAEARRRAEAERTRQAQRLACLGRLAGGIAHDFNNILGIILNYTEFVAEQARDETLDDLGHIRTAAERAAGLTGQLLGFIRQDEVRFAVFDANTVLAESHALLARTLGEHVVLTVVPSPDPVLLHGDAGQLQQIIVNLAVNARDAMPGGGTVVIAATGVDVADGRAGLKPGRYLELLVSDTGTGMPPETVARIFDPFFTTKPKGQGTGLGLATVRDLVTAAGGGVSVVSKPGIGTTFRIYLRRTGDFFARPDQEPDTVQAPRGGGQSVLVVEDDPVLGSSIARILAGGGYRVRSAPGAAAAVAAHAQDRCDLLVTDVVMPEMSGPRLVEILHRTDPGLPVLYCTGYPEGTPGGACLAKPFSPGRLLTAVHAALQDAARTLHDQSA